jgi:hypothetical protein
LPGHAFVCQTFVVMPDAGFLVLKYKGETPVLATCLRCQLKFLTPAEMMGDFMGASEYLSKKYKDHHCKVSDRSSDKAFGTRAA